MTNISGHDRSQMFLLPESVDDYVGVDNPVRFIDAFVDERNLAAAGFVGVEPKATGRPGYAPADLSKLYIYGYLNRVRSSWRPTRLPKNPREAAHRERAIFAHRTANLLLEVFPAGPRHAADGIRFQMLPKQLVRIVIGRIRRQKEQAQFPAQRLHKRANFFAR
jgi:hypothetical protein